MIVLDKIQELALKDYNVSTVTELKAAIVDTEYQKIIDKYLDEVKLRIMRKKRNEVNNYEPTDEEIIELLQAKLDVVKQLEE